MHEAQHFDTCQVCGRTDKLVRVHPQEFQYLCATCYVPRLSRQYLPGHKLSDKHGLVNVKVAHRHGGEVCSVEKAKNFVANVRAGRGPFGRSTR